MFINVYKCLYKFDLGDTNVWMLDTHILALNGCSTPDILHRASSLSNLSCVTLTNYIFGYV